MTAVRVQSYTRTYSINFFSDNMRIALREIIRENGLSPDRLMQDWLTVEKGVRAWLQSGHLERITVEFYKPGTTCLVARWDFPVGYTGSGVDDDMWLDRAYLRQLIAKAAKPTPDCVYRITLRTSANAPYVEGFNDVTLFAVGQLSSRAAGTAIATGHLTAGIAYWR